MSNSGNDNGPCVLIVEHDANALHTMRDHLARAGFRVHTAANGWDALKSVTHHAVEVVIAESEITDMEGCHLREKFLLDPAHRDVPFLLVIPEHMRDKHVRALRSGVDDCIAKPFDPLLLVARVQAVLERRRVYEQMVRIDPLTRLLNRPTLFAEVEQELNRLDRYNRTAALVLLDLDHYAKLNEERGVAMGDLLLTCVSGLIMANVRSMDLAGRLRGEQFLLYLPETEMEGARIVAQRIQEQLRALSEAMAGYVLTFSCGMAQAPEHGLKMSLLTRRLQAALSQAKQFTHGAITVWAPDMETQGE